MTVAGVPPRMLLPGIRETGALALILLLAGCAGSPRHADDAASDSGFTHSLPGVSHSGGAMMSPADNPLTDLSRFKTPEPAVIREALLEEHERWSGTPYRLGGTTRRGVDCSALVQNVYDDSFEISLPRTTRGQVKKGHAIDRRQLRAGDLVFFRPPGSRHVGIYVKDGYFLHASTSKGVIMSRLDNTYWQRYYWQSRRPLEQRQMAQLNRVLSPER
ncbi:C40 family peptidase [Vreelandella jeotgali]|uniref:C40 family peptidase n=1 Tax=Vreelandella jeotgali TaxID=553386 RepID=UPI00036A8576|nr:NlpC/P60 family protein [Halomonas jeotgali]